MHKTVKIQIASGIIIALAFIIGAGIWGMSKSVDVSPELVKIGRKKEQGMCTQEAKRCPDGSYVGRTGENCEFAACPGAQKDDCAKEGESIGAVYPGAVPKKCCPGMAPIIPKDIVGTQGICQKIKK